MATTFRRHTSATRWETALRHRRPRWNRYIERRRVVVVLRVTKEFPRLLLLDVGKEDHEAIETQLFFDMEMMIMFTGKERTEKEWAKLFFDAGFINYKITPMLGLRSLIEVFP
ncbi:hypothetical protein RD792_006286 [Penstemon davidsonii]|uniref:O-methyltransferase C-terminal domain-containing protein n=1 Tax=Penstemon davidsonii TaxID=160366 RepID=A0ABR0DDQ0_9LAMI|nr:hypothetical protein RD792_006286 [Penstemon davidsonii]